MNEEEKPEPGEELATKIGYVGCSIIFVIVVAALAVWFIEWLLFGEGSPRG